MNVKPITAEIVLGISCNDGTVQDGGFQPGMR